MSIVTNALNLSNIALALADSITHEAVAALSEERLARILKVQERAEKELNLVIKLLALKEVSEELNLSGQVQPGRKVRFDYGRGEKKRSYEGVVLARRDPAEGEKVAPQCRVQVGEGFDIEILTIHPQWVTALLDEAPVAAE